MIGGSLGGSIRLTPTEMVFRDFLGKVTFFEKMVVQKISEIALPEKRLYLFLSPDAPFPSKGTWPPRKQFFPVFSKNRFFFAKTVRKRRQKRGKTSRG